MPPRSRGLASSIHSSLSLVCSRSRIPARSRCAPLFLQHPHNGSGQQSFTTSRHVLAKKDKSRGGGGGGGGGSSNKSPSSSSSSSSSTSTTPIPTTTAIDPYDYSDLESGIAKAVARLKEALAKTRNAGRVSADMIEGLAVELNEKRDGGGGHKERVRLGDVATVVPKGARMMQVFCGEESHVRAITTSIQASAHSLVPTPDAQNPLLLLIPVPPATAETRALAAAEAKKSMERASLDVRTARGDAQKRFRRMELEKLVVKDELRKAHDGMEKVVKRGAEEVKSVYEGALKALER